LPFVLRTADGASLAFRERDTLATDAGRQVMETHQPYRPPRAGLSQRPPAATGAGISPRMIASLDKTRPWVVFLAILMIIGSAFLVIAALAMLALGSMMGLSNDVTPFGGAALGGVYFLLALLYLFPSLYLWRYGRALRRIGRGNVAAVEEALEHQASFWRYVGIFAAVIMVIYVVAIVIGIVMGVMMPGLGSES
jgi:hypothetical protein